MFFRMRSSLGSMNTLTGNGGYLLGLIAALIVPVYYLSLVMIVPSVFFLALVWRMPESPVWLMRKERVEEARKTVQWLRGDGYDVEPEMKELEVVVLEEKLANESSSSVSYFSDRTFLMPLFIICIVSIIQGLSGSEMMSYYAITIFHGLGINESIIAIIFQVKRNI